MCGFFGIFIHKDQHEKDLNEILNLAKMRLGHRGPDQSGINIVENHGVYAARLSVQGGDEGNQPIKNPNTNSSLIYNGEIYNFDKLGFNLPDLNSDTLCLFKYLEIDQEIDKLNGMFAFAYSKNTTTLLARDRFGIKPLYYIHTADYFAYSSEAKALFDLIDHKEINSDVLAKYLSFNYLPGSEHIYKNIKSLQPGHTLEYNHELHSLNINQYSDIIRPGSIDNKVDLDNSLYKSIQKQTNLGHREKGIYFSGGMDSALLAANNKNEQNFTLYNVSYNENDYSEFSKAKEVSDYFKMNLKHCNFNSIDFVHDLPNLVKNLSSPLADPGHFPLWFLNKWINQNTDSKVLLSGDGADELFAGYQTVAASQVSHYLSLIPWTIRESLSGINIPLSSVDKTSLGLNYKINKFLSGLSLKSPLNHFYWRNVFNSSEISNLMGDEYSFEELANEFLIVMKDALELFPNDSINQLLYTDFKTWLPQNNLLKVDHSSSSHGLEARVPYLDNELVNQVFRIKGSEKYKFKKNKPHLRNILKKKMPNKLLKNKSPFIPPYQIWFDTNLKKFIKDSLYSGILYQKHILDRKQLRSIVNQELSSPAGNPFKIYNLLHLEYWMRENN